MHDSGRTANLLGAAALAVTDGTLAVAPSAAGTSVSGSAALVTLLDAPTLSVTDLGRRIGLSRPAAARMVDSLEAAGLVLRPSAGRSVALRLIGDGTRAAEGVLRSRVDAQGHGGRGRSGPWPRCCAARSLPSLRPELSHSW